MSERPIVNAMLRTVLLMIQDAQALNQTGKSWEMVYDEAKARLYKELDLAAGPPRYDNPAPPPPGVTEYENLWAEYLKLYQRLDDIRVVLGLAPYPDKGLNAEEVRNEVVALVARCRALQHFVKPPAPGQWGSDWNGVVHRVERLVKT